MVDIALPSGQILKIPTDDVEKAKRIATNYYNKNKDSLGEPKDIPINTSSEIDRSGISNSGLRRFLARAENDEEYELRLQDSGFTSDMYMKDPKGVGYIINRDKLTPELREKYEIEGKGLLSVEDAGISFNDFQEFFAGNRGAIIGGTAASLAATGVGLPIAMVITGAGSAAGYLLDEGLEYTAGLQAQSGSDVARQAGMEFAFGAGGEGVGRALSAGFARLIKGSGSKSANQKRSEAREVINKARAQGSAVSPTVFEVNEAPVAGRLQAIYEGVFPNQKAAQRNADFVIKELKDFKQAQGVVAKETDYKQLSQVLRDDIVKIYGDPNELIKNAERNMRETVDVQLDAVKNLMGKPDPRGGKVVADALDIAKRTFDEDVDVLFTRANEMLGKEKIVDVKNLKSVASGLVKQYKVMDLEDKGFFQFVKKMPEMIDVQTANSHRTALNHASFDPSIVGSVDSQVLTKLNEAVKKSFDATEAMAKTITATKGGVRGEGGKFISKQPFAQMSEGFDMLRKAQRFYGKGIERFKAPLTQKVYEQYISGKNFNPNDLLNPQFGIIVPDNGRGLNRFLNSVVPSGKDPQVGPQALREVVPEIEVTLPSGQPGKLPDLIEQLPEDDSLRKYYEGIFAERKRFADRIAKSRKTGVQTREAVRRQLAGMYLTKTIDKNKDVLGAPNITKIVEEINALGDTKNALFTKEGFEGLERTLQDIASAGRTITPEEQAQLAGKPIAEQVRLLKDLNVIKKDLEGDALYKSLEKAIRDENPDKVASIFLKKDNAGPIIKAKKDLGENSAIMEAARDLSLRKILAQAADPDVVNAKQFIDEMTSGKFARDLESTLNSYGDSTLEALFGKDTLKGLRDLIQTSRKLSDESLKGKGGLAAAQYAAGLGLSAYLTGLVQTASIASGLALGSKILRSKPYISTISRPTGGGLAIRKADRPGGANRPEFDALSRLFEAAHRVNAQLIGSGMISGKQRTDVLKERIVDNNTVEATPSVTVSSQRAVVPPRQPGVQVQYDTPSNALLGTNPMSQAINAEIARRLNR